MPRRKEKEKITGKKRAGVEVVRQRYGRDACAEGDSKGACGLGDGHRLPS